MQPWIDITVPDRDGMVNWPGDGPVEVRRVARMEDGSPCNVTLIHMTAHTGTHMDAPRHFLAEGAGMETWTPEATIGECRVIEIHHPHAVTAAELAGHDPQPGERLLFKTQNSHHRRLALPDFDPDFVYIDREAAALLAERGVRAVGIDYYSVGGFYQDGVETHVALLTAGIWAIEGLDLTAIEPGRYELNCLPLLLEGADGAPCRALLRKL